MSEWNENNMDERIRKVMKSEPVPNSLKPEQIERLLHGRRPKKLIRRWISAGIAAAAALTIGTAALLGGSTRNKDAGRLEEISIFDNFLEAGRLFSHPQTNIKKQEVTGLKPAENYEQVKNLLQNSLSNEYYDAVEDSVVDGASGEKNIVYKETAREEAAGSVESAVSYEEDKLNEGNVSGKDDGSDYSTTNIQEEGVGEADLLLTDGTYLYMRSSCSPKSSANKYSCGVEDEYQYGIRIVKPDQTSGKLNLVSDIPLYSQGQGTLQELYLYQDRLIAITSTTQSAVRAITYDISDREHPVQLGQIEAEGYYADSRLVGKYLYLFTRYNQGIVYSNARSEDERKFIPCIQGERIAPADIYVPEIEEAQGYLIGVSISLEKPEEVLDQFSVLMNGEEFYVSQEHIYLAESNYINRTSTIINKFSYKDGQMEPFASGTVNGTLNDSFSMDEYNGYLRLVTTSESDKEIPVQETFESEIAYVDLPARETVTSNNLYILDSQLNIVGGIENLAKGERIYSARFMGDTGFFVTYRQVDPLFSVDLSNPANPVILGELKVSGFSEYLHPYGDSRLLGIGWETSEREFEEWAVKEGMKLSMFNTSDMGNVTEENRLVLEEVSDIPSDHRAVLVNVNKNLFGMAVETAIGNTRTVHYLTFRYSADKGFEQITDTRLDIPYQWVTEIRGAYIGNILYILDSEALRAVSLDNGNLLDTLKF
ncbi:MAG: hypothetical protein HFI75_09535 [Lachnospiraceae bacterium]|nr:hypothetical protein [Lachnospiraceae bacterium]